MCTSMDSKRFRKEGEADATVFRSTLLPADELLMKACRLDLFMEEFLSTVKQVKEIKRKAHRR